MMYEHDKHQVKHTWLSVYEQAENWYDGDTYQSVPNSWSHVAMSI